MARETKMVGSKHLRGNYRLSLAYVALLCPH